MPDGPRIDWPVPPERPLPAEGELLVLLACRDVPAERLAGLRGSLSPREEERARSFSREDLRVRWIAGRGMLREILGRALGIDPARVEFRSGPHGKPELDTGGAPRLRFNVSHSGAFALYALALGREVGADVEQFRARRRDDIARRFFAPGEQKRLFALDEPRRSSAFFRLWTCKEAFLKATGEGLSRSLRSYEIDLRDDGAARLLWAAGIPDAARRWSVFSLPAPEGYAAAAFVEGQGMRLHSFRWP